MLLCTAKEALVKQTTLNNLYTGVFSKLFHSLTIVFFPTNSPDKATVVILHTQDDGNNHFNQTIHTSNIIHQYITRSTSHEVA